MTIYTDAISRLIKDTEECRHHLVDPVWDEGYRAGLWDARDAVAFAEEELQRRLPAIYEEYGVPFS